MDSVRRMLSSYDHTLPHALSDNLWYNGKQPNPHAPRCLPCHLANESMPSQEAILGAPLMREALRKQLARSVGRGLSAEAREAALEAAVEAAVRDPSQGGEGEGEAEGEQGGR
ncbi:hypothetical protein TSOC_009206 [Tetrabaena socialis]|uniref:Uncharacterized protein n=1 Tax=Tetrabaena socialis TaxID=47790 RepID=A0A2J7ZWF4_9CHLO|nr:hypothetical protein TSOC_009206 [Tetrabaena socialis]|eukprot:PNH04607.1 hypothetical protein TSOC_009206 [Tetrabaena socialis]